MVHRHSYNISPLETMLGREGGEAEPHIDATTGAGAALIHTKGCCQGFGGDIEGEAKPNNIMCGRR